MSQQIAERADQAEPANLQTNIGSLCHRYTRILAQMLRAEGRTVQFIAKTAGEGQYMPPGFGQHQIVGRDGHTLFTCTGVSHDGLYVDGAQVDTAGGANEHESKIYRKSTEPFWSFDPNDGPQIHASPTWAPVAPQHWRNNNPPLPAELEALLPPIGSVPVPGPTPPTPPAKPCKIPSYGELGDAAYFVGKIGVPLDEDMAVNGEHMNAGSADWVARSVHGMIERYMINGDHRDSDAIAKKVRNEWRVVMNNPLLPQNPMTEEDCTPATIPITCVAGTWGWRGLLSDPTHWTHPKSPLWQYLDTKGLAARVDRRGRGFTWGTRLAGFQVWRRLFGRKPSVQDWEVGAAALYDYHRPVSVSPRYLLRGRNTHMICHSHGGNLPYIAASVLGLKINVLVTVSTPIRHDVLQAHGENGRKFIGYHIHFHSKSDRIQLAGQAGDGAISTAGEHPFADLNIHMPEDAGHSGLLENPFYFDELLTFVEHVHQRHNNPGYLDHRLWGS